MGMGLDELKRLCCWYQREWRLMDWRISVRFVSPEELPEPHLQAHSSWNENSQDAEILIIDEQFFDRTKHFNDYDAEQCLAHEMAHLRFVSVDRENCPAFEFAIDSTADLVVALRRQGEAS